MAARPQAAMPLAAAALLSTSLCTSVYIPIPPTAVAGFVDPIILALCVASSAAGLLTTSIYCIFGSNMYTLILIFTYTVLNVLLKSIDRQFKETAK